jgi:hypothetical protein
VTVDTNRDLVDHDFVETAREDRAERLTGVIRLYGGRFMSAVNHVRCVAYSAVLTMASVGCIFDTPPPMVLPPSPPTAQVAEMSPEENTALLERVSRNADALGGLSKLASYTLSGTLDDVKADGSASAEKRVVMRWDATSRRWNVLWANDHGNDVTTKLQRSFDASVGGKASKSEGLGLSLGVGFPLPFATVRHAEYRFAPARRTTYGDSIVAIAFEPKTPARGTLYGSALVKRTTGALLSVGATTIGFATVAHLISNTVIYGGPALPGSTQRFPSVASGEVIYSSGYVKETHIRLRAQLSDVSFSEAPTDSQR